MSRFSDYILEKCNRDAVWLKSVKDDYRKMSEHLAQLADNEELSEFYRHILIYLSNVVVENLTGEYK